MVFDGKRISPKKGILEKTEKRKKLLFELRIETNGEDEVMYFNRKMKNAEFYFKCF